MNNEGIQRVRILITIAQTACDNAASQYDDYYKSFVALDGKAQSSATVGGIVIAAVVAFVNAGKLDSLITYSPSWGYFFIFSPAASALIAVLISFCASKVVEVTPPFAADDQIKEMQDLADLPAEELSEEHALSYHHSRLTHWNDALENISSAVDKKADWVWSGQMVLVFSLSCLLLLLAALVSAAAPSHVPHVSVDPF